MGKKMELGMMNKIPCKAEGKDVPFVRWIKVRAEFSRKKLSTISQTNLYCTIFCAGEFVN
jgi:hypothetical protein